MCGIAGFAGRAPGGERELVEAMLDRLVHRGPDAGAARSGAGWALGARRLAIIDLETGDQPVANESGAVRRGLQRRDLQLPGAARGPPRPWPPPALRRRHRGAGAPVGGRRPRDARPPARDVRTRGAGQRPAGALPRPRPSRQEASLLDRRSGGSGVRLRAESPAGGAAAQAGARARCAALVPEVRLRARGPVHPCRREQAASRPLASARPALGRDPGGTLLEARAGTRAAGELRRGAGGAAAPAARGDPFAATVGRPAWRPPFGGAGLGDGGLSRGARGRLACRRSR